ncbi:Homeobox protein ATH1 [Linum grandiflorum]
MENNGLYKNVRVNMEGRNWFTAASDRMASHYQEVTSASPLLLQSLDFNNSQQQSVYGSMLVEPSNNSNIGISHLHQDPHALSYAASLHNQFPRIPAGPSLLHPAATANYQVPNDLPFALEGGYGGFESSCSPELVSCWVTPNNLDFSTENPPPFSRISNELSLTLATSQNSVINNAASAAAVYEDQTCCSSKQLSLDCSSQVVSGSKYLNVIQEILTQIANCSLENIHTSRAQTSWLPADKGGEAMRSEEEEHHQVGFEIQIDPALQKRALQAKKVQLLGLLQMVDERYNQCVDEIHTVVSAFHAATELDPKIHTRFALQTISFLYRDLKERISNQILVMGPEEGCPEYLEKKWSIGQLKKKEHQFWRPQRGLPERSVAVLRAWMFHNFLHPYPKDAEKHLLAVKSGLTRSQVSNWFINARVRVWKPMIEEMYAEMNRRKGSSGTMTNNSSNVTTSQISIRNCGVGMPTQTLQHCDDEYI